MSITIHRGLDQIGGCVTEISTATSRVFVDMGKNLPGSGRQMSEEEEREYVANLFSQNKKENEAVIYTHAHEDHVGMFVHVPKNVPQYIGEGGRDILLATVSANPSHRSHMPTLWTEFACYILCSTIRAVP